MQGNISRQRTPSLPPFQKWIQLPRQPSGWDSAAPNAGGYCVVPAVPVPGRGHTVLSVIPLLALWFYYRCSVLHVSDFYINEAIPCLFDCNLLFPLIPCIWDLSKLTCVAVRHSFPCCIVIHQIYNLFFSFVPLIILSTCVCSPKIYSWPLLFYINFRISLLHSINKNPF